MNIHQTRTLRAYFHAVHALSFFEPGQMGYLGVEAAEKQLYLAALSLGVPDVALQTLGRDAYGGRSESTALEAARKLMVHKFDQWGDVLPLASGFAGEGNESGVSWVLYSRQAWDDGLVDVDTRGSYGGPGRGFQDPATVKIGRSRVLVKQRTGLDI